MSLKREILYTLSGEKEIKYTKFLGMYMDDARGPAFVYLLIQGDGKRDLYEYRIMISSMTITENIVEKELAEIKEKIKNQLEDIDQFLARIASPEIKLKKESGEKYPSYIG